MCIVKIGCSYVRRLGRCGNGAGCGEGCEEQAGKLDLHDVYGLWYVGRKLEKTFFIDVICLVVA